MSHKAKKHLGQNFLTDQNVINKIVQVLKIQPSDKIVEIGPGQGALTHELIQKCKNFACIEFDPDLVALLERQYPGLELYYKDALTFDFVAHAAQEPIRVVGNLPYNISTPILFHLLSQKKVISDMTFMLQKEVVDRICAPPGSKKFGRLSVMIQYSCKAEHLFEVPAQAFDPAPKVQSAVVKLTPYQDANSPFEKVDTDILSQVLACAFSMRRKTLRNALKPLFSEEELNDLSLNPKARPETLGVEAFVSLAKKLELSKI